MDRMELRPLIKLAEPAISQLHVQVPLTNLANAVAGEAEDFVAMKIAPPFPVTKTTDKLWTMDIRAMFKRGAGKQNKQGYLPEIRWLDTTDTYNCERHGCETFISNLKENNADDAVKPSRSFARISARQNLIDFEVDVLTAMTTASNFTYTSTLSAGQRIDDGGDVDVIVKTAHTTPLVHPNAVLLAEPVMWALQNNGQIKEKYKYTGQGVVPESIIQQVLRVKYIFVSKAKYDSADPAAAASYGYIMGNDMLFFYLDPSPSMASMNTAWTFWYREPGVGGPTAEGSLSPYYVTTVPDARKEGGGYYYGNEAWYQPSKIMQTYCSYLYKTACN